MKQTSLPVEIGYEFIPAGKGTRPVSIDIFSHTLMLGKSRTGKSSAAYAEIMGAIRHGHGCLVQDPHGPLVAAVLSSLTPEELARVVYINPLAPKLPGIGYFDSKDLDLAVSKFVGHMEIRSGRSWGPRTAEWFLAVGRAVVEFFKRATILHVYKMFSRDGFAQSVFKASKDPIVQDHYAFWYGKDMKAKDRIEAMSHPRNKVVSLIEPGIREIVGQPGTLDWAKLMDEGAIIIVDIQKHKIGADKANTLGMLVLQNITDAAPNREHPERKFLVAIDEAHNYLSAFDVETAVAESAKWGLVYLFIDQNLTQLRDEERKVYNDDILLGNCSNILSFRVSGKDAKKLADEFGNPDIAARLIDLANYRLYAWTLIKNNPILKGPVCTYPIPKAAPGRYEKALAWVQQNTGTDRAVVEAAILEELKKEIPVKVEKPKKRGRSGAGVRSER